MKEKNMSVPTTLIILISSVDSATGYSTIVTRCLPIEMRKIPKMFLNNNSNNGIELNLLLNPYREFMLKINACPGQPTWRQRPKELRIQ